MRAEHFVELLFECFDRESLRGIARVQPIAAADGVRMFQDGSGINETASAMQQ